MTGAIDYSAPGRLTDIGDVSAAVLEAVPADPVGICRLVPGLVLHPFEATDLGLDAGRLGGREIRQASEIIGAVLALDPAALDIPREPGGGWSAPAGPSSCRAARCCATAVSRPAPAAVSVRTSGQGSAWITGSPSTSTRPANGGSGAGDADAAAHSFVSHPEGLRPGEFLTADNPRHVADPYSRPELRAPAGLVQ